MNAVTIMVVDMIIIAAMFVIAIVRFNRRDI
jgi:ABC-type transport system involved in multi-copper enzyme maturation permease subunit